MQGQTFKSQSEWEAYTLQLTYSAYCLKAHNLQERNYKGSFLNYQTDPSFLQDYPNA